MKTTLNHEIFEKPRSIIAIKFNSFQRKPLIALIHALMLRQDCLSFLVINKILQLKTTTNTGKIQKFSRKVREESAEAI